MGLDNLKRLRDDTEGAAFLEFTVFAMFFFTFLFGVIEFTLAYYQWNAGTKAVQLGARLAAVSSPVSDELAVASWDLADYAPGEIVDVDDGFTIVCTGAEGGSCSSGDYNADAMNTLVFGRGNSSCAEATAPNFGMCHLFSRVKPEHVKVTYTYTGMGYAGRPGGPVPTIRVELVDIPMQFIFFDALFGLNDYNIPGLASTMSGEDLSLTGT
jgi:hypothetical protein